MYGIRGKPQVEETGSGPGAQRTSGDVVPVPGDPSCPAALRCSSSGSALCTSASREEAVVSWLIASTGQVRGGV
jgi:hypothetical protein